MNVATVLKNIEPICKLSSNCILIYYSTCRNIFFGSMLHNVSISLFYSSRRSLAGGGGVSAIQSLAFLYV
jgi:hypothetical protein